MAIRSLSPREKIILSICALLILAYFGVNFIFEPIKAKIDELNNQIGIAELKLKKSNKIIGYQESVEDNFKKYADLIKQKSSDEQEMSALLSEIEAITKDIKISISDMKPSRVRAIDFYKKFSVELEAEGLLEDLTKFIHTLQSQPHFLKIERMRLERRSMRTNTLRTSILISRIRVP
ncbi:MAG: type 4a pilus biogenesis protein PilO [Candidatus Omnitrophica bacterium]|nr:type 4a pilus biogenesis protein PilO [Candidatus Omnitrophota bacterium]HOX54024.1 type 4a pilus biogenesis protein PilO [Candidatus Omnitrophota bacterium]